MVWVAYLLLLHICLSGGVDRHAIWLFAKRPGCLPTSSTHDLHVGACGLFEEDPCGRVMEISPRQSLTRVSPSQHASSISPAYIPDITCNYASAATRRWTYAFNA